MKGEWLPTLLTAFIVSFEDAEVAYFVHVRMNLTCACPPIRNTERWTIDHEASPIILHVHQSMVHAAVGTDAPKVLYLISHIPHL